MTADKLAEADAIAAEIYALTAKLEKMFPGRPFTPDGHLVGSLGEVVAAHRYGLTLNTASTKAHDAVAADGRQVEIKLTSGGRVALRHKPDHLLVLRRETGGAIVEVYNGPGALVWDVCGPDAGNGQHQVSISRLRKLAAEVAAGDRLPVVA